MSAQPAWKRLLLRIGLRALAATWRIREEVPPDCAGMVTGGEPCVVAFWHGMMIPVWYRFRGGSVAVVSGSADGELLADYLTRGLRYATVIRGSSSRGGGEALAAMVEALKRRRVLITPDGPRGPLHQAKPGALVAALRSSRPVLCCSWNASRAFVLGSWDGMLIPYPFARVEFRYCKFKISPADISQHIPPSILELFSTTLLELSPGNSITPKRRAG